MNFQPDDNRVALFNIMTGGNENVGNSRGNQKQPSINQMPLRINHRQTQPAKQRESQHRQSVVANSVAEFERGPVSPHRPVVRCELCSFCGYDHTKHPQESNGSGDKKPSECGGDKGDGDKPCKKDGDSGTADEPPPSTPPDPDPADENNNDNRGRGRDWGDPGYVGYFMSSPLVCFITLLFLFLVGFIIFSLWYCQGTQSFTECYTAPATYCRNMNRNLKRFLLQKQKGSGTEQLDASTLSLDLQMQLEDFRKAVKNSNCLKRSPEKCTGLSNYAGLLAGSSIVTTRETVAFPNPILCRCQDEEMRNKVCNPDDDGVCSNCVCQKIEADTILKDDDRLTPGQCWAFSGKGEIMIGLLYPIIVTGITLHHPHKGQLLHGYFKSAPKDFEVWGYKDVEDASPHFYGAFQYLEDSTTAQLFEVKNMTRTPYSNVQFNFLSNYGNPNYTAVYKVEVHGLYDRTPTE